MIVAVNAGRAVVCLVMIDDLDRACCCSRRRSRCWPWARPTPCPAVLSCRPSCATDAELVEANSKLQLLSGLAVPIAALPAGHRLRCRRSPRACWCWPCIVYAAATVAALRIPATQVAAEPATAAEAAELRGAGIVPGVVGHGAGPRRGRASHLLPALRPPRRAQVEPGRGLPGHRLRRAARLGLRSVAATEVQRGAHAHGRPRDRRRRRARRRLVGGPVRQHARRRRGGVVSTWAPRLRLPRPARRPRRQPRPVLRPLRAPLPDGLGDRRRDPGPRLDAAADRLPRRGRRRRVRPVLLPGGPAPRPARRRRRRRPPAPDATAVAAGRRRWPPTRRRSTGPASTTRSRPTHARCGSSRGV